VASLCLKDSNQTCSPKNKYIIKQIINKLKTNNNLLNSSRNWIDNLWVIIFVFEVFPDD
jgi:hypothetical protein